MLRQFRMQVRLENDDDSEDPVLEPMLAAAMRAVENRTGRTFGSGDYAIGDANMPVANQAALMLAAHWYRNRESVAVGTPTVELPMAVEYLIAPLARMSA